VLPSELPASELVGLVVVVFWATPEVAGVVVVALPNRPRS
jgi:hypothetical protein